MPDSASKTSDIKLRVDAAVKDAMRARAKQRLGVLRLLMAEFKRIEVDERITLDDERVLAILDKMTKQRNDSLAQYQAALHGLLIDPQTCGPLLAALPAHQAPSAIAALHAAGFAKAAVVGRAGEVS